MINKRLIAVVKEDVQYIKKHILWQWIHLLGNIVIAYCIAHLFFLALSGQYNSQQSLIYYIGVLMMILLRFLATKQMIRYAYLSSYRVKDKLRTMIFNKLLILGHTQKQYSTAEIVQISSEGVEQLEIYFARFLPQFFYALIAPMTLFLVLLTYNFKAAIILLVIVPLIPISIILVQKFAKRILANYWGIYTSMGDHFLDYIQGLTTLKIFQDDAFKNQELNQEAETFRVVTMKVLTMQLNSVTLMDLIAFGGSAIGMIIALLEFRAGHLSLTGMILFILLSAEFFIPLRLLGSYFHIAMNGMAASEKIFGLLDLPEPAKEVTLEPVKAYHYEANDLSFSYHDKMILKHLSFKIGANQLTSIVGVSGCGKSTLLSLLSGMQKDYHGNLLLNGNQVNSIDEKSLYKHLSFISDASYLFAGSLRDNLLLGHHQATDQQMMDALKKVKIDEELKHRGGLDLVIEEGGINLSGGQIQRIAIARALLHEAEIYLFDEATSNVDVESERIIFDFVQSIKNKKTIIVVSHRLKNVVDSDLIMLMSDGKITDQGTHQQLMKKRGHYYELYEAQATLETVYQEVRQ